MAQADGTLEARLNALKARIDAARTEKARAEATLEQLERQRAEILAQLVELGVTEDELPAEIERLEREIAETLTEAERLLRNAPTEAAA